jgi:DNA polymerase III sliding clamp (beta) subunit (PCNA family)
VDTKAFIKAVRAVKSVDLSFSLKDQTLSIVADMTFKLPVSSAEYCPITPEVVKFSLVKCSYSLFSFLTKKCGFSTTDQKVNRSYSGFLFKPQADGADVVSTDIYRISVFHSIDINTPVEFVIPVDSAVAMSKIFKSCDSFGLITTDVESDLFSYVEILSGDWTYKTILLKPEFPNYRQVLPPNSVHRYSMEKKKLTEVVSNVLAFSKESTKDKVIATHFRFGRESLVVETPQISGTVPFASLLVSNPVEPGEIGLNAGHVLDVLKVLSSDVVDMGFNFGLSPAVFRETGPNYSFTHLVMPLRMA